MLMEREIENQIHYRVAKIFLLTLRENCVINNDQFSDLNKKLLNYYEPFIDILYDEELWKKEK